MELLAYRILSLILFSSAVFVLCTSQGMYNNHWYIGLTSSLYFGFNVSSDQCVTPQLDYSEGRSGSDGTLHIYSMSPFTSCNGRIVGYKFCYENTRSTTGVRVATVLLLEDVGVNYYTVRNFTVKSIPGEDNCLSEGIAGVQCCVSRNLSAENQFGVNSSYLYGVVDLPGGPNMRQTHPDDGHCGYQFDGAAYTRDGDTALSTSGNPTNQPLRIFQFIIGELRFTLILFISTFCSCTDKSNCVFTCFSDNSTSDVTTPIGQTSGTCPTSAPPLTGTFTKTQPPVFTSATSPSPPGPTSTENQPPAFTTDTSSIPTDTSSTMVTKLGFS